MVDDLQNCSFCNPLVCYRFINCVKPVCQGFRYLIVIPLNETKTRFGIVEKRLQNVCKFDRISPTDLSSTAPQRSRVTLIENVFYFIYVKQEKSFFRS